MDCKHLINLKIDIYTVNTFLYDHSFLKIPSCKKCLSQDDLINCLTCGFITCISCDNKNPHEHSIFKPFIGDSNKIWCNDCKNFICSLKLSNEQQLKLKDLDNSFRALKLFIYYDNRNTKFNNNLDNVDKSILEIIKKRNNQTNNISGTTSNLSISQFINSIKNGNCKNIIVLTGAGISVGAGLCDFRSPNGVYNSEKLKKLNLPTKETAFTVNYLKSNPIEFYDLLKDFYPNSNTKPTPVHHFIKLLSDKGILLKNYCQNVDTLEKSANVPINKIIESHGTFNTLICLNCKEPYTIEYSKTYLFPLNGNSEFKVPKCNKNECNGILKPDIILFGEPNPNYFYNSILQDINKCDGLIVIGTSLKVHPFASIVNLFQNVPRLLINNEIVGENDYGGFNFTNNKNDLKLIGDCQQTILNLSKLLDWENDLKNLLNK